jgi:hypothetical protein
MGGLMFAATSAAAEIDSSAWMAENPWVSIVLGVVVSGLVHTGKVAARPVVNLGTGGLAAPVVSTAEDGASVGLSLAALFAPLLALVGLLVLAWALIAGSLKVRRWRRRRGGVPA